MATKRKRAQKNKDFVKQKLKVGKSKLKASNHTDTSFTAKTIHVPLQSVLKLKTSEAELLRNASLTKHNTPQVRKEGCLFIQKHIDEHPTMTKTLITAIAKLIIDQSSSVRNEAYNTLKLFSPVSVQLNYNILILYIQSAMTHINQAIRNDSTRFLELLIGPLDSVVYLVNNNWIKLIKSFFSLLHWPLNTDKKSIALSVNFGTPSANSGNSTAGKAAKLRHLQVLNTFVSSGAIGFDKQSKSVTSDIVVNTPHLFTTHYLTPDVPAPYSHLQLFTRKLHQDLNDLKNLRCEDTVIRRKVLVELFANSMAHELTLLSKEGGEIGRFAKNLLTTIHKAVENEEEYKKNIGDFQSIV